MDRREALKKLGLAGAVAAGGSVVLSSNSVAYAVSGTCIAQIPDSVSISIAYMTATDSAVLTYSPTPGDPTSTYVWSGATLEASTASPFGVVRQVPPSNLASVKVERAASASGARKPWTSGDRYRIDLQITWSCPGIPSDVAVYRVTTTYNGTTPVTVSAPKQ